MTSICLEAPASQKNKRRSATSSMGLFSFFSGAGFLDFGFETSGYKIDFVNEFHNPFMNAYIHSRKLLNITPPEYGHHLESITEYANGLNKKTLTQFVRKSKKNHHAVGFIGGPPCPDFSIGGKNRGHTGENGKLSGNYVSLICEQFPDFFLFENVKGLWKTKRHREFYESIKLKLQSNGYLVCDRLINAIEYGAPQDRARIIMIGFSKKFLASINYKLKNSLELSAIFPWEKHMLFSAEKIFSLPWPTASNFSENSKTACPSGIEKKLTVEYWFEKNQVSSHPNSKDCFKPRAGLKKFQVISEGDDSKKSFKRLHRWRYSPTACYGNNEVHLHPYKARRLSVAEVLAIQSLPKEYTLPSDIGLSNLFKTVGNGVPYLAAKGLAASISSFIRGDL